MPLVHRVCNELEDQSDQLEKQRAELKRAFNEQINRLLDDEVAKFRADQPKSAFGLFSYVRGIYYLSMARFTNPIAHRMAWQIVDKLNQQREEEEAAAATGTAC